MIPVEGSTWIDVADATENDNSLFFNAEPEFEVGDQLVYTELADQGFRLNVSSGGVVVIRDGKQTNEDVTFKVQSYHASEATWYEEELITYKPSGFSASNTLGGLSFFATAYPLDSQTITDVGDPNGGDGQGDGGGDDGNGGGDTDTGGDNDPGDGSGGGSDGGSGGSGSGGGDTGDGGDGPVITPGGQAEEWVKVDKPTTGEVWS